MVHIIMDHRVSRCFGIKLAPIALTCRSRNSDSPTSDNLSPQETINQDTPDMGLDGAGLSCPGSSEVAEGARFETTDTPETIEPDLTASVLSQPFTEARGR
jgi:hypothetical protein